jgi:hypothetical protein
VWMRSASRRSLPSTWASTTMLAPAAEVCVSLGTER